MWKKKTNRGERRKVGGWKSYSGNEADFESERKKKRSLRLRGEKLKGERRIVCKGWRVQDGWGKCPVVLSGRAVGKQFSASLAIGCGRDAHRYRACELRWYKVVIAGLLIVKLYPFNSFSKIVLLLMVCLYRSSGYDRL